MILKKIVRDEKMNPIEVQINYEDWKTIENLINDNGQSKNRMSQYSGINKLEEDPVHYQRMFLHKKIVTDERMHPIAVIIDYADWIKIEQTLGVVEQPKKNLNQYSGVIKLSEDPIHFQRRIRDEWS